MSSQVFEYGGGASWHFYGKPLQVNQLSAFIGVHGGVGKAVDETNANSTAITNSSTSYDGNTTFMSVGVGIKYFTSFDLSFRAMIDYYRRSESYDITDVATNKVNTNTKVVAGPRILLGIGWVLF